MSVVCHQDGIGPGKCHQHCVIVFSNDDESGLHYDYEVWLEELAPHAPVSQRRPTGRLHNRTGQACLQQALVLSGAKG